MTSYLTVKGTTYLGFECLIIVGVIYLCITFPLSKLVGLLEKKLSNDKSYKNHRKRNRHTIAER